MDPSHGLTMGPPSAADEHRDAWARRMPPAMAESADPAAPPKNARARLVVTASHPHPLDANWRSWAQHASEG